MNSWYVDPCSWNTYTLIRVCCQNSKSSIAQRKQREAEKLSEALLKQISSLERREEENLQLVASLEADISALQLKIKNDYDVRVVVISICHILYPYIICRSMPIFVGASRRVRAWSSLSRAPQSGSDLRYATLATVFLGILSLLLLLVSSRK